MGALLSYAGYISTTAETVVQQPESAINMVMILYKWGPIITWVVMAIVLSFYKLDKIYPDIMKELKERESRGEL